MGTELDDADAPRNAVTLSEAQYIASSTIYGSNDPVAILNALVDFGAKDFARAQLGLLDTRTRKLSIMAVRDDDGVHSAFSVQPLDIYPAYETLSAIEALCVPDVATDPFLTPEERNKLQGRGIGALLAIPLLVGERLIGVVDFRNPQPTPMPQALVRSLRSLGDQIAIVFENQSLLREAQANANQLTLQVRLLQGLNRLSSGMSGFKTERELLDYAAETLKTGLNVDHVGIALFEPREDHGMVVSEYPDHKAVGSRIETRNSAMIQALRADPDKPFIAENVPNNPMIEPETRAVLEQIGVVGLMVMALQISDQMVGTVGFDLYDDDRHFDPEMIDTARTIISQVALSLENIRLVNNATRLADQIQRVALFGQSMQANLRLDAILNILLSESQHIIPMDRMSVALYDANRQQLRTAGETIDGSISVDLENGELVSLEGTLTGEAWTTGRLISVPDANALPNSNHITSFSLRSAMIAPLRSRGRLFGTVSVGSARPYSYESADEAIFQQLLNQLAIAIENAEAYTQSQRIAQNEALVNDIATRFQQQSDVEVMLETAVSELGRALGARRARIRLALQPDALQADS